MTETLIQEIGLSRLRDRSGYIHATVSFQVPSNVSNLSVGIPPGTDIRKTSGFTHSGGSRISWNRSKAEPEVELRVSVGRSGAGGLGASMVDTGDWAIVEAPNLMTQWRYRGVDPVFKRRILLRDRGVASVDGSLVYLGPHYEHTEQVAGQNIRVIEPQAASLNESPRDILSALAFAAKELPIGGRNDEIVGIAAPTRPVNWGPGGLHAGGNAFWARDSARLDKPNSTWVHEYIHTRQDFSVAPDMKWFIEATAVYYATRSAHLQETISDGAYHGSLNTSRCANDVLAAPRSWSTAHVPYQKGSRVAAWLDNRMREVSGVTLADAFRKMNQTSDGSVTDPSAVMPFLDDGEAIDYEQFKRILAEVMNFPTSSSVFINLSHELDNVVTSNNVPEETPPPGLDEIPSGSVSDFGMPTDISDLIDEAFGEEFGEELIESDGRIDEGSTFSGDGDDGLIDSGDIFEGREGDGSTVRIESSGGNVEVSGDVDDMGVEISDSGISIGSESEIADDELNGGAEILDSSVRIAGDRTRDDGDTAISVTSSGGVSIEGDVFVDEDPSESDGDRDD